MNYYFPSASKSVWAIFETFARMIISSAVLLILYGIIIDMPKYIAYVLFIWTFKPLLFLAWDMLRCLHYIIKDKKKNKRINVPKKKKK